MIALLILSYVQLHNLMITFHGHNFIDIPQSEQRPLNV